MEKEPALQEAPRRRRRNRGRRGQTRGAKQNWVARTEEETNATEETTHMVDTKEDAGGKGKDLSPHKSAGPSKRGVETGERSNVQTSNHFECLQGNSQLNIDGQAGDPEVAQIPHDYINLEHKGLESAPKEKRGVTRFAEA